MCILGAWHFSTSYILQQHYCCLCFFARRAASRCWTSAQLDQNGWKRIWRCTLTAATVFPTAAHDFFRKRKLYRGVSTDYYGTSMRTTCKALRVAGGSPATLARSEGRINATQIDGPKRLGANRRLANAKSSMLQANNPDVVCTCAMYGHELRICANDTQHGTGPHGAALRCAALRCAAWDDLSVPFFIFTVPYVALLTHDRFIPGTWYIRKLPLRCVADLVWTGCDMCFFFATLHGVLPTLWHRPSWSTCGRATAAVSRKELLLYIKGNKNNTKHLVRQITGWEVGEIHRGRAPNHCCRRYHTTKALLIVCTAAALKNLVPLWSIQVACI